MSEQERAKIGRRKYLKYAGGVVAVAIVAVAGYGIYGTTKPTVTPTPTATPTTTVLDRTPPVIKDFQWQPIRVMKDKVYDAVVSFTVKDAESTIADTNAILLEYPGSLPIGSYPEEPPRPVQLTPPLGATLGKTVRFSGQVNDLKGGKQYQVTVSAKDSMGNKTESRFNSPYMREFENISGIDDILVMADYYTWYERIGDPGPHWYHNGVKTHVFDPLLGEYASGDEAVISKHIDWATGNGIDAFLVSWWSTGTDERTWDHHLTQNLGALLKNPLTNCMRFAILYENNGRLRISNPDDPSSKWVQDLNGSSNKNRLVSDFEFFAENYFVHPSYLKIKDKPVARFDYTIPFRGDIVGVFAEVRAALEKKGFSVYLINDLMGRSIAPFAANDYGVDESHFREITEAFDAIGASNFPGAYGDIEKDTRHVENVYKSWRDYAKMHKKDFIPAVWPGHQGAAPFYVPPLYLPLERSPERLGMQIKLAKQYSTCKTISVISFNEWIAGSQIEPSKEEGFAYLKTIKDNV